MEKWIDIALKLGFSHVAPLRVETLQPRQDIREQCASNRCGAYGKNWTCPPYCGSLEECTEKLGQYRRGILLQTVGKTEKLIDTKAYRRTEQQHRTALLAFVEQMQKEYPRALCLCSSGCRICDRCAWPEPCRFPEQAFASMEAYGLFVTQVCRDNDLAYYHGERTVTYTACVLF